jgi:Mlc titration factor MtfA (ptsG expression regulator)
VILSWESVLAGLSNPRDGRDTAAHEFAHVLDRADGAFDGTPALRKYSHYRAWAAVMDEHFQGLRRGRPHERKVLDDYGALNEAEFFAVATESFFEKPRQMKAKTPELYEELRRFYGWDPAAGE